MEHEEELVRTPSDRMLAHYAYRGEYSQLPDRPFRFNDTVVATNGKAICIANPMLCNQVYLTPDNELPSHFTDIFSAKVEKADERNISIGSIKKLIAQGPEDFKPRELGCVTCGDSGTCTDCDCGSSHECGKCEGAGHTMLPAKKLIGIGTGSFALETLSTIAAACGYFELEEFEYLGSRGDNHYLQFFKIGDCDLILASATVKEDQERVCLEQ